MLNMQEECCICYNDIELNKEYAIINNDIEKGIYHVHCLENWIQTSNNGILTQDKITSYIIFNGDSAREIQLASAPPLLEDEQF